jgi:hypothetical protein
MPIIGNATILDLSLPGTHDSLTYDSSTTVADLAEELPPRVSNLLHNIGDFLGIAYALRNLVSVRCELWVLPSCQLLAQLSVTPAVRTVMMDFLVLALQVVTQGLNVTQQLDSGVRFIDFRLTLSRPPYKGAAHNTWLGHLANMLNMFPSPDTATYDWYSMHMIESNQPALSYFQQIRVWLDAHPSEVLVLWMSRHGTFTGSALDAASAPVITYMSVLLVCNRRAVLTCLFVCLFVRCAMPARLRRCARARVCAAAGTPAAASFSVHLTAAYQRCVCRASVPAPVRASVCVC